MSEKKKIKLKKKERSIEDDIVDDLKEQVVEAIDAGTVADPEDGQLQFEFLDFGSFFDSSDPDDVA